MRSKTTQARINKHSFLVRTYHDLFFLLSEITKSDLDMLDSRNVKKVHEIVLEWKNKIYDSKKETTKEGVLEK
jgi:hypothetical protein